jgi:hypothetical protein
VTKIDEQFECEYVPLVLASAFVAFSKNEHLLFSIKNFKQEI